MAANLNSRSDQSHIMLHVTIEHAVIVTIKFGTVADSNPWLPYMHRHVVCITQFYSNHGSVECISFPQVVEMASYSPVSRNIIYIIISLHLCMYIFSKA